MLRNNGSEGACGIGEPGSPRFAVLLAAYNGKQWLGEQINSILKQQNVDVTVFVSVDLSSDGTEELVDSIAVYESRICVLPHGERFGGAAGNFFRLLKDVDLRGFDYVAFADQDDIWLLDKLMRADKVLLKSGADGYSSNVVAFWPSGKRFLINKSQPQKEWDFLFEAAGPGCTYVFTSRLAMGIQACLEESGKEAEAIGLHDWFSYAFARANGYRWVIDDYAGVLYRQHGDNQVGVNTGYLPFFRRARKILSGWGLGQAALIARLVGLGCEPFVQRWINHDRRGVIWLAFQYRVCRRRVRDQIIFALSCVLMAALGKHQQ